jgi:ATP phosphoribosyltransferase
MKGMPLSSQIRIALPSKGRMEGETLEFLDNCGLRVNKTNPRQYTAVIPVLPNVQVLFQRPRDIPITVASGDVDLGITGYDTVVEAVNDPDADERDIYLIHEALDYGQCELVLAVPDSWDEVLSVADLENYAAQKHLRVATKYGNTVNRFLERNGMENVRLVYADGALEAAPRIGYADFIADISSTGTTLRENHLHLLEGGTLIESQAVFIGNRDALIRRPEVMAVTEHILELIEAHLRARGQYMLVANMRGESMQEVGEQVLAQPDLGGLQWPTIAPLATRNGDGKWWSVSVVVKHHRLYPAIQQVRAIGGSGVVVTPVSYIFDERPERCNRLAQLLQEKDMTG